MSHENGERYHKMADINRAQESLIVGDFDPERLKTVTFECKL